MVREGWGYAHNEVNLGITTKRTTQNPSKFGVSERNMCSSLVHKRLNAISQTRQRAIY